MPSNGGGSLTTITWSLAASSAWGKTDRATHDWLPLVQHLEDAAGVAGHLWDTWLPGRVTERLAETVGSESAARALAMWLAGVHDVGKATPAFAIMAREVGMEDLVDAMERQGLRVPHLTRHQRPHHSVTGHLAVQRWLVEHWDWSATRAGAVASVVGGHHGTPPTELTLNSVAAIPEAWGTDPWDVVRAELLSGMAERSGVEQALDALRTCKLPPTALVDLSALVIVADWLASDVDLFPYTRDGVAADRLAAGVVRFDLPAPWRAEVPGDLKALFRSRFPHLAHVRPNAFQLRSVSAALDADTPPLLLIEAPTGSGKSEAALLAAEALAARHGCGGVVVALPTMATSDAMFERVLDWVRVLPQLGETSIYLAHGKASLNDAFTRVVRESHVRGVDDDGATPKAVTHARVSSWLNGRKRGLLANFVVGTIDQVLMAGLKTRHLALRHLALSGKVVVVDEVHAADDYMRAYLKTVLGWLGAYGTPVVLLSATLPPAQREELVTAYRRGRERRPAPVLLPATNDYPLITTVTSTVQQDGPPPDHVTRDVMMEACDDDLVPLTERLVQLLVDGGCVGVIRNTVGRAQETYDVLHAVFGADVELVHSRFVGPHRMARESSLRSRLGPGSGTRPQRLVLVGTQVLEQSLDIDLDLLVTDLAPIDLVLQRIGRLHRHDRPREQRPASLREPRCLVTGVVDWGGQPPRPVRGSNSVYGESRLLRSAAVLGRHLDGEMVRLPADVPSLVHAGYDPGLRPPPDWQEAWLAAESKEARRCTNQLQRSGAFRITTPTSLSSLVGWIDVAVSDTESDSGAKQVRDSEDGIEVIVVVEQDGGLWTLPGDYRGADRLIPEVPDDRDAFTRDVLSCTVRLPYAMTAPWAADGVIEALERAAPVDGWQGSRWLGGQLVLPLDADLNARVAGFDVSYSFERGLTVRPRAKETT